MKPAAVFAQDKDVLLSFPQGHLATSMERHLIHMLEGYRAIVTANQETRPYSPGSARDESFQEGVQMAKADLAHRAQRTDSTTAVDYRKVLIKYITHIGMCEGVTFIHRHTPESGFTEAEWAALVECDIESDKDFPPPLQG